MSKLNQNKDNQNNTPSIPPPPLSISRTVPNIVSINPHMKYLLIKNNNN